MWLAVAKYPGLTMTVSHMIEPADEGSRLTECATLTGPLATVAARLIGGRLEKDFAGTTARIARLAEASPLR